MGTLIVALIIGIVIGGVCTWLIKVMTKKDNLILLGLNCLLGALGSIAATKLVLFGPILFGVSIVPAIVGALVLDFLVTYVFIKVSNN